MKMEEKKMSEKRKQDLANASLVTAILMLIVVGLTHWKGENLEPIVMGSTAAVLFILTFLYSSFSERIDIFQEKHKLFSAMSSALLVTLIFAGGRVLSGRMELKKACIIGSVFFIILTVVHYRSICSREKKKETEEVK